MVKQRRAQTKQLIRCSSLIALSLLLLLVATVIPTARFGIVAISGLFTGIATMMYTSKQGFLTYFGTSLIAAIVLPNKGVVLLYILLFGIYPILKILLEYQVSTCLQWLGKSAFFCISSYMIQVLLMELIFTKIPSVPVPLIYALSALCFLIYDFGVNKLNEIFQTRFQQLLEK